MTDDVAAVLAGERAWAVVQGHCADVVSGIRADAVDAVITDPPYGMGYQSAWRTDRALWKPRIVGDEEACLWWLPDAYRVTRLGGCLLCFCTWQTQETFRIAIVEAGFTIRSHVVWDRLWHGMADVRTCFAPSHDIIWFASKGRFEFPGDRPSTVLRARRRAADVIEHPAEKPVGLMAQLVKAVTRSNDVVLDPFCGSGATGCACLQERRRFIGVEIEPTYVELATRRISNAYGPLFALSGGDA